MPNDTQTTSDQPLRDAACSASLISEVMCEACAGGGSRWQRTPSAAKYEIQRMCEDSGSGIGRWVFCHSCNGKGFISQQNTRGQEGDSLS